MWASCVSLGFGAVVRVWEQNAEQSDIWLAFFTCGYFQLVSVMGIVM